VALREVALHDRHGERGAVVPGWVACVELDGSPAEEAAIPLIRRWAHAPGRAVPGARRDAPLGSARRPARRAGATMLEAAAIETGVRVVVSIHVAALLPVSPHSSRWGHKEPGQRPVRRGTHLMRRELVSDAHAPPARRRESGLGECMSHLRLGTSDTAREDHAAKSELLEVNLRAGAVEKPKQ
jgi:hypothetical protein